MSKVEILDSNENPFLPTDGLNAGSVQIEQSRAMAEALGALKLAKLFPRDNNKAYAEIMAACSRPALAKIAFYSYPRGSEIVSGPSIRLAEELARCWGNIQYGIIELGTKDGVTEMQAFAWDLQTNVKSVQNFTVRHERHTKKGVYDLKDPRDIYELTANQAARRLRARILAVIPPDVIEAAVVACRNTEAGKSDVPFEDRIKKMVAAFGKLGISVEHIEAKYGCKISAILPDQLTELIGIHNAIRDNVAAPSDFFKVKDGAQQNAASEDLNAMLDQ